MIFICFTTLYKIILVKNNSNFTLIGAGNFVTIKLHKAYNMLSDVKTGVF